MVRWLPATLTGITICVVLLQTVIILPSIPYQWNKVSNAELTAIYLKEGLVPGDLILVGYPNNAPIWYYLELHDVPDSYWNTEGKFSRALILLAANQKDQTLEGIVKSYQLDPALFALDQAQNIGHIGQIYVYESEIR